MSNYVKWYNNRKDFYKVFASRWAAWASGTTLTDAEVAGMSKFFSCIARRFGLTQDFVELGIIRQ